MPRHELLIGAAKFWARAQADIAVARRRVLVQAMTFEGDATGLSVADAILGSAALVRRVAVDDYTRLVINDRWAHARAARREPALQAEVRATADMFARLAAGGVEVAWTEPVRRVWRDYPFRNHRKIIVADDVAYIGGINFSDHNFAWPDLMVRMERADAADRLGVDFPTAATGSTRAWRAELEGLTLHGLDGLSNADGYAPLLSLMAGAREEIVVFSPYLSFPFTGALASARRAGARVTIVTSLENNKPMVRRQLVAAARRADLNLVQTLGMSHAKAMLVDGRFVVLGSSNFDFASYRGEAEVFGVFDDPELVRRLRQDLLAPALAQAVDSPARVSAISGALATGALRIADGYIRLVAGLRARSPR